MSKIDTIIQATSLIANGDVKTAEQIIKEGYPFVPVQKAGRNYTMKQMMEQFYRDGFIDRYSGDKLINPGMLRVISEKMPEAFPYQAHWKTDECHTAYWDYQPTVDHIYPVALGGKDEPENWASTSMVNNSAKSNFTIEQLGWTLKPVGNIKDWDGLSTKFIEIVEKDQSLLKVNKIKGWYIATKKFL
jgi:hypothetical protein